MKKKIGIVGWNTGENSFGITKPYAEYFSKFGQVVILTPSQEAIPDLDLLVLPGGLDLAPNSSEAIPSFYTSNTDVMKQYFYEVTLRRYMQQNTKIFGICLGFQQLCAWFGATLQQHIPYFKSGARSELVDILKINNNSITYVLEAFKEVDNIPFYQTVYRNEVLKLHKYYDIDKEELENNIIKYFPANSIHHQGINVEFQEDLAFVPGTEIQVVAYNPLFNNLEAAWFNERVAGVQYHPKSLGL